VRFLESSGAGNREEGTGAPSTSSGNGGGNRSGSREQQDPFIDDGKPIDISDDDLPF
jgi:single-strand DNA-binding protein